MKILEESKRFLAYGGLGNEETVILGGHRISRTFIRLTIYSVDILLAICLIIKCINGYAIGIQTILYPLHCLILDILKLATYGVLIRKTERTAELYDYLHMVVNQRCNLSSASRAIYAKRGAYEKQIVRGIAVIFFSLVLFSYGLPALCWLSTLIFGVPSADNWAIPVGIDDAIPTNTHTPVLFGISLFTEYVMCQLFMVISIEFAIFYINICTYFWSCIDDLSAIFVQKTEQLEQSISMKMNFVQFIELHKHLYRMIDIFESVVSAPILLQVPLFGVQFAAILYQMENNITNFTSSVAINISELIYYAIDNYVLCNFISSITLKTVAIGDIAYNSPWYQMPRNQQIMVEMIIRRSQRPYEIKGMGVFVCSLETFLKLTRSAISYYMVFRKLNAN